MWHAALALFLYLHTYWTSSHCESHAHKEVQSHLHHANISCMRWALQRETAPIDCMPMLGMGRMLARQKPYFHTTRYRDGRRPGKPNGYYVNMTGPGTVVLPASLTSKLQPCNQLQFDEPVQGKWYRDNAGHWAFELDRCKLWRPLGDLAGKCLGGKRVVMLGDSVSRYQYTTLAHYLATKQYQHPYDDAQASVSNKYQWKSWDGYYAGVSRLVTRLANQHGTTTCDCQHGEGRLPFEVWRFRFNTSVHNYVSRRPPSRGLLQQRSSAGAHVLGCDGHRLEGGGVVTPVPRRSLTEKSGTEAQSHKLRPLNPSLVLLDFFYVYKFPTFLIAGLEGVAWAFNEEPPFPIPQRKASQPGAPRAGNLFQAVQQDASYWGMRHWRPPDILIFNMGIFWWSKEGETLEEVMTQVFKYAQKLAARYSTRLIWKTTSVAEWDEEPDHMNELVTKLAKAHGFEVRRFVTLQASRGRLDGIGTAISAYKTPRMGAGVAHSRVLYMAC